MIVLRGAGDVAFVSGADISEFEEARNAERAVEYAELTGRAFAALTESAKPVVAMIHGFCVGGGHRDRAPRRPALCGRGCPVRDSRRRSSAWVMKPRVSNIWRNSSGRRLLPRCSLPHAAMRRTKPCAWVWSTTCSRRPNSSPSFAISRRRSPTCAAHPAQRQAGLARTRSATRTARRQARRRIHSDLPRQCRLSRGRAGVSRETPAEVPRSLARFKEGHTGRSEKSRQGADRVATFESSTVERIAGRADPLVANSEARFPYIEMTDEIDDAVFIDVVWVTTTAMRWLRAAGDRTRASSGRSHRRRTRIHRELQPESHPASSPAPQRPGPRH